MTMRFSKKTVIADVACNVCNDSTLHIEGESIKDIQDKLVGHGWHYSASDPHLLEFDTHVCPKCYDVAVRVCNILNIDMG